MRTSGAIIRSLHDFLIEAKLSRYSDQLIAQGGMRLDQIKEVTEDQLLCLGVTKEFHRRRFLREARQMVALAADSEAEESLGMDFVEWLRLHNASQYETAFRDELEGAGTLEDVTKVIVEQGDLGELVGVTGEDARVLWEAIERARSLAEARQ